LAWLSIYDRTASRMIYSYNPNTCSSADCGSLRAPRARDPRKRAGSVSDGCISAATVRTERKSDFLSSSIRTTN